MWSFKLFFTSVWTILKPVVIMIATMVSKEILEFILETVTDLSETDLTNEAKRQAAFARIKEKLKTDGKELRTSVINLLIEWAVVQMKKKE